MFKLGRRPRKHYRDIPHYSVLRLTSSTRYQRSIAPIPDSIDYSSRLTGDLGAMCNDQLGDCTCAAFFHARQVWTSETCTETTEPDSNVLKMYEEACGYNPADPSTDQGGVEQDVLSYLLNTGAPVGIGLRDKIRAFVEVTPTNIQDLRRTIYDCGVAYIGVDLPNSAMQGDVWDVGGDETIAGGHAVVLCGYDANARTFKLISWGRIYTATEAFIMKFCDEAYGIADASWIAATGKTPLGMSEQDLDAAMQGFKEASCP